MGPESRGKGRFTLPGEAGYEDLTMELAERWGADAIRDSDGTVLSDRIIASGLDIYSTLCLVRADNAWARANQDKLQQNFLMSHPLAAPGDRLEIDLLRGYFREQFRINTHDDPREWWQVFDRTAGEEIPAERWEFDPGRGVVTIHDTVKSHRYTVNFLAYTIWEAISMYNHITNDWGDREHLMPIDPIYPEAREFILDYLRRWLAAHPRTKVVRFTSMFYNFAWFWGDSPRLKYVYSDWGGYDHTVSPYALRLFERERGYRLTSEDFVNKGAYCSSHNPPSRKYRDWMDFVHAFVAEFGRQCVDLVHAAGKQAYMFYDDHWIGTEPYGPRFKDFGFDGLIKCVFNGFEARLCAGAQGVKTKELRLHPYLFPTGLKGEPTFKEGGDPARDCRRFWLNIRRALLREPVDRIGLGGYLHLVREFPDFVECVGALAEEFRTLRELHAAGRPYAAPFKVAVLTAWGRLRSWICNGHMIPGLELNELIESLAGLPFAVEFMDFDDLLAGGIADDVGVVINCGRAGSAWCGGDDNWRNERVVALLTDWVERGGGLIGVGEPSASEYNGQFFQLAHVLGVDRECGRTLSRDKPVFEIAAGHFITGDLSGEPDFGRDVDGIFVLGFETEVLAARNGSPRLAAHGFGRGRAVYFSGFKYEPANTRLLHRALYWAAGREGAFRAWTCANPRTECAYYPGSGKLAVVNNTERPEETEVFGGDGRVVAAVSLEPGGLRILQM